MSPALARHEAILQAAIAAHNGQVFKTLGDAFCVAFPTAASGLEAALAAQQSLAVEDWSAFGRRDEADLDDSNRESQPDPLVALRVRMALHTGAAEARDGDYFGPALNRTARLMAAGHGGQVLLSLATQELVRDDLPSGVSLRDMGERRLKDLRRPEHVFQVLAAGLDADFPPLATLDARPNNLPLQLTGFVGREREMAEVKRLVGTSRLVTLTGVGGTGKTRLALQLAADLIDDYDHGVCFADLAPIGNGGLVARTVATVLDLQEEPGRAIEETLAEYVKERRLLVVLDNCEQVVESCATLVDGLLRVSGGLRVLATSREALAIGGEVVWPVPPLEAPDPARLATAEDVVMHLSQFDAVRLFIDRAVAVRPEFRVTNENAPSVAEICHRLDGIPLAIELAAARVKVLAPEQILARLGERFRLLTGGSRTALPRQQTLRAAIDWSHDLLDEGERTLFRRLAVFRGGWTLESAEAVCSGAEVETADVLDVLGHLADKSLVAVGEGEAGAAKVRYRYLETVREFAMEKLVASGELVNASEAHMAHFLSFVENAKAMFEGPQELRVLSVLDAEHDNFQQALDHVEATQNAQVGLRFGSALLRLWNVRGYFSEGRARLGAILSLPGALLISRECADTLNSAGVLAWFQSDYRAARSYFRESLAIRQSLGDDRGVAVLLGNLGNAAHGEGDYPEALALYRQSLDLQRQLDDRSGAARTLNHLGNLAFGQGDYPAAEDYFGESLDLRRALGDRAGIGQTLTNVGIVAHARGDYSAARRLYEESLVCLRDLGDKRGVAIALSNLGDLACQDGEYVMARTYLDESLEIRRRLGDSNGIGYSLHGLGNLAHQEGDYVAARTHHQASLTVRSRLDDKFGALQSLESCAWLAVAIGSFVDGAQLLGAAEGLRDTSHELSATDQMHHDRAFASCCAALGEAAFKDAWARGQVMTLDEAVALALEFEPEISDNLQPRD